MVSASWYREIQECCVAVHNEAGTWSALVIESRGGIYGMRRLALERTGTEKGILNVIRSRKKLVARKDYWYVPFKGDYHNL